MAEPITPITHETALTSIDTPKFPITHTPETFRAAIRRKAVAMYLERTDEENSGNRPSQRVSTVPIDWIEAMYVGAVPIRGRASPMSKAAYERHVGAIMHVPHGEQTAHISETLRTVGEPSNVDRLIAAIDDAGLWRRKLLQVGDDKFAIMTPWSQSRIQLITFKRFLRSVGKLDGPVVDTEGTFPLTRLPEHADLLKAELDEAARGPTLIGM